MEINDEHEVGGAYAFKTMLTQREEGSRRHLLEFIKNESNQLLLFASYQSNARKTLQVINITEANVIDSWNLANHSDRLLNLEHLTNHSYSDYDDDHFGSDAGASLYNHTHAILNATAEMKDALSFWDVWASKPFPSGYTQLAIVLLALFLTCIMILVVVGNMLVCIAITTEKSLKPVQNWFIASLAVSDFGIGLVIMPFSLARELMGYWMFGQVWCDVHAALDVLLCTASINNLFLISLDRYWSITQAVKYLKERTHKRAAFMIGFVWIFSALVSLPPLVGWKKAKRSSEYPQCNLSDDIGYVLYSSIGSFYFPAFMMVFVYARILIAARSRARKHIEKKRLKISANMTRLEHIQTTMKEKSSATTTTTTTNTQMGTSTSKTSSSSPENALLDNNNPSSQTQLGPTETTTAAVAAATDSSNKAQDKNDDSVQTTNYENINLVNTKLNRATTPPQIIIESSAADSRRQSWNIISTSELISSITCDQMSLMKMGTDLVRLDGDTPSSTDLRDDPLAAIAHNNKSETEDKKDEPPASEQSIHSDDKANRVYFSKLKSMSNKTFKFYKPKMNGLAASAAKDKSLPSKPITIDDDSDTIDSPTTREPQSYESKLLSAPRMLQSKFGSTMSIADYDESDLMDEDSGLSNKNKKERARNQYSEQHGPVPMYTASDAERHKRKIAKARERRATLIVGLIMAAFITAWLPFFVLYVLAALCMSCKENIPQGVFAVAFWLGYCNSAANPIIYTIFNRDFRRAFRKILFK